MNNQKTRLIRLSAAHDQLWKRLDARAEDIARIAEALPEGIGKMNTRDVQVITFAMCSLASILLAGQAEQSLDEAEQKS